MLRPLILAVALLSGCAGSGPSDPLRVQFLDTGFLVDNTVLASPAELQAYLSDRKVRSVRLQPMTTTSRSQVDEATGACERAGVHAEVTVERVAP